MTEKKEKNVKIEKKEKKPEESAKLTLQQPTMVWNPFDMVRRFDEEFEDFRRDIEQSFWGPSFMTRPRLFSLPNFIFPEARFPEVKQMLMDIKDTGKEFVVEAEMPGIPKENIDIELTEDGIVVCGNVECKEEDEEEGYYKQERSYSKCFRQIPLPEEIIPSKADAKIEDGILKIVLPKKNPIQEPKTHKLKVN